MLKIAIGSDHAGYEYKQRLISDLKDAFEFVDVGTDSLESTHYPIYGKAVGEAVINNQVDYGVVICSSGEGIMIAANKIKGVRAGIAYNDDVARLLREHNNANVISFGASFMDYEDVKRRLLIFVNAEFAGGRHQTRVDLLEK